VLTVGESQRDSERSSQARVLRLGRHSNLHWVPRRRPSRAPRIDARSESFAQRRASPCAQQQQGPRRSADKCTHRWPSIASKV
jgi:hypothetical protein